MGWVTTFIVIGLLVMCLRRLSSIETRLQKITVAWRSAEPEEGVVSIPFPGPRNPTAAMIAFALLSICCTRTFADEPIQIMKLSVETRNTYYNTDGSCVQCSIGMVGCHCNDLNAAYVLFDSEFGPAERGGSNPSRVEAYCNRRGIKALSITGATIDETIPWMKWAAQTGRFAAVGAGTQHFQTLYGYDPNTGTWALCNNQTPHKIDYYPDPQFRKLHQDCMPWCVILLKPSSPPPQLHAWWSPTK